MTAPEEEPKPWEFKKLIMSDKDLDPECLVARLLVQEITEESTDP